MVGAMKEGPQGPVNLRVPPGDDRQRLMCDDCGYVAYSNPRLVVGSVPFHGDRILLCRRAIEPRAGFWTLPAGYLEEGESPAEGALREAREEAEVSLQLGPLLAVYTIRRISQVQFFYLARVVGDHFAPGPESEEVALFAWDQIPYEEIAFPSVLWALAQARVTDSNRPFAPYSNPEGETGNLESFIPRNPDSEES